MDRKEWLEKRKSVIGGTDIAAIIGKNPWKTPLDVYLDKIGESEPFEGNEYTYWGTKLEEIIAERYAVQTQCSLKQGEFMVHPEYNFIGGTPDRLIQGINKGVEIKSVGMRSAKYWGDEGTSQVPLYYLAQVAWYMAITGYDSWDIVALIGGNDFRIYPIERNLTLENVLIKKASDFWNNHVLARIAPEIDGSESAENYLRKTFKSHDDEMLLADSETIELANSLLNIREEINKLCEQESKYKNLLMSRIGNKQGVYGDNFKITWKKSKDRSVIDYKSLVSELNVDKLIIEKHTTTKEGSRTFLIKEVK